MSRAGEVLSPAGALTGGRRHNERQANDHSLLGRKRALRHLSEELGDLALQAEEAGRMPPRQLGETNPNLILAKRT